MVDGHNVYNTRDQFRYLPSQWVTLLHCNDVSHWLGAYLNRCLNTYKWLLLCCGLLCFFYDLFSVNSVALGRLVNNSKSLILEPNPWINVLSTSCEIASPRWMALACCHHAIIWANVDPNLCHHIVSQDYNELIISILFRTSSLILCIFN